MPPSPDDKTLLFQVLQPLLEDFQYWFGRSLALLDQGPIHGLAPAHQAELKERLQTALSETQTASVLLAATDGQVGVDPAQVKHWHTLVAECWAVARRHRRHTAEHPN